MQNPLRHTPAHPIPENDRPALPGPAKASFRAALTSSANKFWSRQPRQKPRHARFAVTAVCCAAVLLFSACGGSTAPSAGDNLGVPASSAASTPSVQTTAPVSLTVAATGLFGGYAGTEEGCYTLYDHQDNSTDILYIDYHSLEMNMLDAPARTAETRGHISDVYGTATPVVAGGHLYIFVAGTTYTPGGDNTALHTPYVLRTNLHGTDPVSLSLPQGDAFEFSSNILWDGSAFYCITRRYSETDTAFNTLTKIDFDQMETSVLRTFSGDECYSIAGIWQDGPLLRIASCMPPVTDPAYNDAWNARTYRLCKYTLASGAEQDLLSWRQNDIYDVVQENVVYFWRSSSQALYTLNADTGVETLLATGLAPEDPLETALQKAGDRLMMQFATNRGASITQQYIDPATGEVSQPPLKNLGENVFIFAQTQDYFLVQSGERWAGRDENTPGGAVERLQVSVPELSLIAKTDYWAGNASYIPITDNVY